MVIFTLPELKLIMPQAGRRADLYYDPLHASMESCDINNQSRAAMYLATVAHESAQLVYMAEIWGPAQVPVQRGYRNRMGNNKPEAIRISTAAGDSDPGHYFRGYGPIQITGFDNQCDVADNFGIEHSEMVPWLQRPEGAFMASAYFWMKHGLNELADDDDHDDVLDEFDAVCDTINRGHRTARIGDSNGWLDRVMFYKRALTVLSMPDFSDVRGGNS